MERSDWVAVGMLLVVTTLGALAAGSAVLYGRSETLRNVRNVDERMIVALLRAQASASTGEEAAKEIDDALGEMVNKTTGQPYVGLTVRRDGVVVASNLDDGMQQTTGPSKQSDDQDRQSEKIPEDRDVDLGHGLTLEIHRYESRYAFDNWHSFLTVPMRQLIDGRDVYWGVVKRKALRPAAVTFALGLILVFAYVLVTRRSRLAIERLEDDIQAREVQVHELQVRQRDLESARDAAEDQLQSVEQQRAEAESRVEQLRSELNVIAGERDMEHAERQEKERDLRDAYDWLTELNGQQEEARKEKGALEESLRVVVSQRDQRTRDLQDLQQELESMSRSAASATAAQGRMLERLWDAEWHGEARKEALDWFMRRGQPEGRRRLVDLLTRAVDGEPPRSDSRWEPMKPKDVLHNGGKDAAKLYWGVKPDGRKAIVAVSGGKDDHERFAGGAKLTARWQSLTGRGHAS